MTQSVLTHVQSFDLKLTTLGYHPRLEVLESLLALRSTTMSTDHLELVTSVQGFRQSLPGRESEDLGFRVCCPKPISGQFR